MKKLRSSLSNFVYVGLFCFAFVFITINSSSFALGIKEGLKICFNIVIPGLFVFMVFCLFASKLGAIDRLNDAFYPITKWIVGPNKNLGGAIFLSFMGGYPIGAKILSQMVEDKEISAKLCKRLLPYFINAGPSFLISVIGLLIFNDIRVGVFLYISQIISSIILIRLSLSRDFSVCDSYADNYIKKTTKDNVFISFTSSVYETILAIINLSGYIILFSAIIFVIKSKGITSKVLLSLLEVTSGIIEFQSSNSSNLYAILFLISFGGLCVIFQAISFFKTIRIDFFRLTFFKIIHGIATALVGRILLIFINLDVKPSSFSVGSLHLNIILYILFILSCAILIFVLSKKEKEKMKYSSKNNSIF